MGDWDFEIREGGPYPEEYEEGTCSECGWSWGQFRLKRVHDCFTKNGRYEFAELECRRCGCTVARFRVDCGWTRD